MICALAAGSVEAPDPCGSWESGVAGGVSEAAANTESRGSSNCDDSWDLSQ